MELSNCYSQLQPQHLEIHLELSSHRRAETVEELSELRTTKIVLYITRIKVIRDVENNDTSTHILVEVRNLKTFQDCRIQLNECRET